jgi:hypothetical protein
MSFRASYILPNLLTIKSDTMLRPSLQLLNFQRVRTPTSPGICKILYLPVECLPNDPTALQSERVIAALPEMDMEWNTLNADMGSAEYIENQAITDAGPIMEISINVFLPFDEKNTHLQLNKMMRQRFIVVVFGKDANTTRWLGSKENPVVLVNSYGSSKKKSSTANGTNLSFVLKTEEKPYLVHPAVEFVSTT